MEKIFTVDVRGKAGREEEPRLNMANRLNQTMSGEVGGVGKEARE